MEYLENFCISPIIMKHLMGFLSFRLDPKTKKDFSGFFHNFCGRFSFFRSFLQRQWELLDIQKTHALQCKLQLHVKQCFFCNWCYIISLDRLFSVNRYSLKGDSLQVNSTNIHGIIIIKSPDLKITACLLVPRCFVLQIWTADGS